VSVPGAQIFETTNAAHADATAEMTSVDSSSSLLRGGGGGDGGGWMRVEVRDESIVSEASERERPGARS
jgi:hypothetical protein